MSPYITYGLLRAAVYYPSLVLSLFFVLWMTALVARSPRKPRFLTFRLKLASWITFAANASIFLYKSRPLSYFLGTRWPVPESLSLDFSDFLMIMRAEALGILLLHGALTVVVYVAGRRLNPAP